MCQELRCAFNIFEVTKNIVPSKCHQILFIYLPMKIVIVASSIKQINVSFRKIQLTVNTVV